MQGDLCQKPVPADETELRFAPRSCVCSQRWGEHFLFILKIETEPLPCVSPAWGHSADNEDASVVPALGGSHRCGSQLHSVPADDFTGGSLPRAVASPRNFTVSCGHQGAATRPAVPRTGRHEGHRKRDGGNLWTSQGTRVKCLSGPQLGVH